MASEPNGARTRGVGAIARGDGPNRRRGLWWLLAASVLLAIIAVVLILALSGGSHHAKKTSAHGAAAAAASSKPAAAAAPATSSSTTATAPAAGQSATTSPGSTGSGTTAAGSGQVGGAAGLAGSGQVGGGGVTARAATGRLAPAGSVGAVLFAEDGIALDANAHRVIRTAVKEIRMDHARSVTTIGYTDKIGNAKANRTLSLERAHAVAAAIRAQLHSPNIRFATRARGETRPVASNSTSHGRQLNRRVTIFVKR